MWIKFALREVPPVSLVAYRVLFGLLFGAAVMFIRRIKLPSDFKTWGPLLILGLTNLAIPFFLISWGEQSIDSSVASILDSTVPLFTIVLAHFLLKDDKMTINKIAGLIMGFTGVVILLSKNIGNSPGSIIGEAAVVLASIFYAGSTVYVRKTTVNTPAILRSTGPLLSASAVMWLTVFFTESHAAVPALGLTWTALLMLGIVGSGLAFIMAFYLIHEIGPTRSTMVTYLFPLGGVILGVTFLHELITWQLITGGVFIVASLVVTNRQPAVRVSLSKIGTEK